ncbi:MAG TPA: NUDIX domain-containing protein [Jatrophihabitans sp.]|jgi:8-oxo-dGTP pyrophosphatase MutT (NUDIX family)|nr:NUDIX domain-containing protein [Jatrophihabitans sp.]
MSTGLEDGLRASGDWLGAAMIVRWQDAGFLFAGKVTDDCLQLSGIGGKVESGESFEQAARREVLEETGTGVSRLWDVGHCQPLGETAPGQAFPRHAAAFHNARPPSHPTGGRLWIAIFVGELADHPRPVEKVTNFVLVPPAGLARIELDGLLLLDHGRPTPARPNLPSEVRQVSQVDTARAVFGQPGLLDRWWSSIERSG